MKHPKLKEIKKYFENAKTIRLVRSSEVVEVNTDLFRKNDTGFNEYDEEGELLVTNGSYHCVYSKEGRKYAEILTYKEKTFSITESQIKTIQADGINYIEEWFPEAFESEFKGLKVGTWYKSKLTPSTIINCQIFTENEKGGYGVHMGIWSENWGLLNFNDYVEATEQEVFEALKNEAVKRGFVSGCWIKRPDCFINKGSVKCAFGTEKYELFGSKNDKLQLNGSSIFENGVWAEVAITLSEAEQQLKKKIIV